MTAKVSLRGVTKAFGDNVVLRDFSLDVSAGEVVSLIGASGSGKTTVLRCINLLEQVDDGAVLLDGDEVSAVGRDPNPCLLYTSPSPRDGLLSRMPSSA